jgi:AcrR family transcriptional regulator
VTPERDVAAATRRAPFSDNPTVGARGQRTQQRILDAALTVFGELGYERTSIDRIAQAAGCSRVSYYQYFASKEDVFRHLAEQVNRELRSSTDTLDRVGADAAGRDALRWWVQRYAAIYARYEPVFSAFPAAVENDEALADGSARVGLRNAARLQAKFTGTILPPRQLAPAVSLLHSTVNRSLEIAHLLESVLPGNYAEPRVADAITDVVHRSLFGATEVNARRLLPTIEARPDGANLRALLAKADITEEHSLEEKPALASLLTAGHAVLVRRGYHASRIDEIVATAGVSRGAFYRYFDNRDALAEVLAARALRALSGVFVDIPLGPRPDGTTDRAALRRWLRRYNTIHGNEVAMTRVWVDAALQEPSLEEDSAAALDFGRRAVLPFLAGRGFGDPSVDAMVMVGLVDAFGGRPRSAADIDAAVHVIDQGILSR